MNNFGFSPLSGLPLIHSVTTLERRRPSGRNTDPPTYRQYQVEGYYSYYTGEPSGGWATNLDFAPDTGQRQARPAKPEAPYQVGELDLEQAELAKLKAYALSIAVQSRLKAQRFGGGKFPLFVSSKEQQALSDFEIETPYNFLPYAIEDLWKEAQALTIPEQANQTLVNLSLLEEVKSSELRIAIKIEPPKELEPPLHNASALERAEAPHGLVFGAIAGDRAIILDHLRLEGLITIGQQFQYRGISGQMFMPGCKTIRITTKGYVLVENLLSQQQITGSAFNLIISGKDHAWEKGPRFSMDVERFLEYTDADIKARYAVSDIKTLKPLESLPTILMYEVGQASPTRDTVRLGMLRDIRVEGEELTFGFQEQARLSQKDTLKEAVNLKMLKWEDHRTHWSVKAGAIPESLLSQAAQTMAAFPQQPPAKPTAKKVRILRLAQGHLTVVKQRITGLKIHQLKHLADLEFNFGDRRLIGFMGPNGCGKTTVLQALACTFRPEGDGGFRFPNFFLPNTDASWDGSKFEVRHQYAEGVTSEKPPPIENEVSLTTTCAKAKDRWTPRQPKKPVRTTTYVQVADCIPEIEQLKTGSIVKYVCSPFNAAIGPNLLASLKVVMGREYTELEEATYTNPYLKARKSFRVVHAGSKYASVSMSAGEQRVIRIIKAALELPKGGLLLIDEIDLFLHPRALEALLNELDKIAEKRELQVFFTSHSIHVFSALDKCQLWQIWQAGGRSWTIQGEHPDAIYRLTAERKIAVQLFCEDDVAHQIVKKVLSDLDVKRHCDISCFGSASNGFTMAASVVLTDVNDDSRVVILDGDVMASKGEIKAQIAKVLSGNSEHDIRRREKAAKLIVPFAGGKAPEFALVRCVRDGEGHSEFARAVLELEAVRDHHRVVDALADRLGLDHQDALIRLVEKASATAGWEAFVAPVKSRVSEILIAKGLLKAPEPPDHDEAKAGDEVDP